jgi:hypothetical protein
MARYAHYVLLRAQCFGGMFTEISPPAAAARAKKSKSSSTAPQKPITATALRAEHLEAATMLLKAGCACTLRDGEECENTAYMVERVAADMMGLTTAVAVALTAALSSTAERAASDDDKDWDKALLKRWCEFYAQELRPQVKAMVSETSRKLDKYGLFLPSRMGASVSRELLRKGMTLVEQEKEEGDDEEKENDAKDVVKEGGKTKEDVGKEQITTKDVEEETGSPTDDNGIDDEGEEQEEEDEEDDDIIEEPKKRREAVPSVVEEEFEEYEYDEDYYDEEP